MSDAPDPSSMEHSDGETAAKREKLSPTGGDGGSEDFLSALPQDVLINILLKLRNTAVAARTSVLSRRWRRVWALLPELHFNGSHRVGPGIAAHGAPALRRLVVADQDASPDSVAAWLPIAARRLSGDLTFLNISSWRPGDARDEAAEIGAFELPCFENATSIRLELGSGLLAILGLALPPYGVFARLTDLRLDHFQLGGTCGLGEAVSSPRCPALRKLTVHDARGLGNFAIHSESLLQMELSDLYDLRQLIVVAPALEKLTVSSCFCNVFPSQPVADISAPQLVELSWKDAFDPSSVELGEMAHLQCLDTSWFLVYGPDEPDDSAHNRDLLRLLWRFEVIHNLNLTLFNMLGIIENDDRYLMEDMTRLPDTTFLSLIVMANGHSFGASLFHVLRMCTGVRKLALKYWEPQPACPSGCICDQPPNWKTEELVLDHLQEVETSELAGTEQEVAFLQRFFIWATVLKKMTISFHRSVTQSKAKDLSQMLLSFSSPETCMKFYVYDGDVKKVLYVPEY